MAFSFFKNIYDRSGEKNNTLFYEKICDLLSHQKLNDFSPENLAVIASLRNEIHQLVNIIDIHGKFRYKKSWGWEKAFLNPLLLVVQVNDEELVGKVLERAKETENTAEKWKNFKNKLWIKLIDQRGQDVNSLINPTQNLSQIWFSPLHLVRSASIADRLIKFGIPVDGKDFLNLTPLQRICAFEREGALPISTQEKFNIIDVLIDSGADINIQFANVSMMPHLLRNASIESIELFKKLVRMGAHFSHINQMAFAKRTSPKELEILLREGQLSWPKNHFNLHRSEKDMIFTLLALQSLDLLKDRAGRDNQISRLPLELIFEIIGLTLQPRDLDIEKTPLPKKPSY